MEVQELHDRGLKLRVEMFGREAVNKRMSAFGDFGNALRANTNPTIDTLTFLGSSALSSLPQIPVFETFLAIILIFGAIYYAIAVRGRDETVQADVATGEATIG